MTEQNPPGPPRPPRTLRWALRCHPAAYRAEHEAELSAIHAEATRDAGPLGRLREALDIAGHGLRLRTGLGSDGTAGQVLAHGAPLMVAVATAGSVANLLWLFAPGDRVPSSSASSLPGLLLLANQGVRPLLWVVALAAVWTGRWSAVRALAAAATVLRLADIPLLGLAHLFPGTYTGAALNVIAALLTGAVILAAPRDLLGPCRSRGTAITGTVALTLALWAAQLVSAYQPMTGGPLVTHTFWAGVFAVALLFSRRDRALAAGLTVALLPAAVQMTASLLYPLTPAGLGALLVVLVSGSVALLRAHRRHAARPHPPGAA
ncbi:hypothetical protein [Streptomyces beihaiensis]|uniref:Integral membrane protein n=1 Tax=Streptomyces beihaiensis TaxID=2984495 RepID=A0ABT3TVQ6_9ACTN|nr:hypothetical protein [Streptomyces beihaiensis]MCX3061130.1 hypothetical protein [Streptomyces beihaiensis]